jgi:hypothetical protein
MATMEDVIRDLENLNREYLELMNSDDDSLKKENITKEDVKMQKENLIKIGQKIIDFYNEVFIPRYCQKDHLDDKRISIVDNNLRYFTNEALRAINEECYFSLGVLLIPQGSKIGNPNYLEKLISSLKITI